MSDLSDDEKQEEEPLDPAVERVQQKLRGLLMRSTFIMVLGLGAVLATIVYKVSQSDDETPVAYQVPDVVTDADLRRASYPLPEGAKIISTVAVDGSLAVTYSVPNGPGGVLLIDVRTWQVFSTMDFPAK